MASNSLRNLPPSRFQGNMDPKKRSQLLGEETEQQDSMLTNKLQNISEDFKLKMLGVKQFVKGANQDMLGSADLPFKENKQKQRRYFTFVQEKEGKLSLEVNPGEISFSEAKKEKEEFERFYKMYKSQPQVTTTTPDASQQELLKKIEELQKQIQLEKAKRRTETWIPDKLLCKRFGVKPPSKDQQAPVEHKKDQFYDEILPMFLSRKDPGSGIPKVAPMGSSRKEEISLENLQFKSNKFVSGGTMNPGETETVQEQKEEKREEILNEIEDKPPFELFKSIFGDDD